MPLTRDGLALRSSAQLVSYEIPLGMSVLGVFLIVGSLNLETVIDWQVRGGWWFVVFQPLASIAPRWRVGALTVGHLAHRLARRRPRG